MTRTFVAADFDEAFLDGAAAIPLSLPHGRRVKRELLHCTLRFYGDVEEARIAELRELVAPFRSTSLPVKATRLDAFSSPRKAHVLVLPIEDDGTLARIHEALGKEDRPFKPHLTLARFKRPADVHSLVATTKVDVVGRIVGVTLYASKLGKDGPTYTPLS